MEILEADCETSCFAANRLPDPRDETAYPSRTPVRHNSGCGVARKLHANTLNGQGWERRDGWSADEGQAVSGGLKTREIGMQERLRRVQEWVRQIVLPANAI